MLVSVDFKSQCLIMGEMEVSSTDRSELCEDTLQSMALAPEVMPTSSLVRTAAGAPLQVFMLCTAVYMYHPQEA